MLLAALATPASALAARQHAEGATVAAESIFTVADPPAAPLTVVQMFLEFGPGVTVAEHTHGGPGYMTMLDGTLTLKSNGVESVYPAGETFAEFPGTYYDGGNVGETPSRLMVTYLVPKGAAVTRLRDAGPASGQIPEGPAVIAQSETELQPPPGPLALRHLIVHLEPGSTTEGYGAEGIAVATVVSGALSVSGTRGTTSYAAGQAFVQSPGVALRIENQGNDTATMMVSVLSRIDSLPPSSGRTSGTAGSTWPVMLGGVAVMLSGWAVRRRRRASAA